MSIKVADVSKTVAFYAYDSTDHISPKDGLSSFTVYYFLNDGSETAITTPTVTEKGSTNLNGWYTLAIDEAGMVSAEGELHLNIKATGMDDVPKTVDIIGNTTKEAYDILNSGTYGLAHLVRSTTPANTLDISATGEAGLDFANIKDATGAHTLTNITVPTVTTLTGHTAQTGDSFARIGATGSSLTSLAPASTALTDATWTDVRAGYLDELAAANLPTDIADIPTVAEFEARSIVAADYVVVSDTLAAVTTVTNLTNAPTNGDLTATMKTSVNTEVDTALTDINLDHLVKSAVDTNFATTVQLDSVIGQMVDVGSSATFDRTTDSNEAIRNKQTDIETDTAEIGTAGAGLTDMGGMSTGMKAEVNAEADTALTDYDPPTDTEMIARTLPTADYVVTTDTIAGVTTVTNLTNAPTSGDLTATMKLSVNTECDTALTDYDGPTKAEMDVSFNTVNTNIDANETKIDIIDTNVDAVLVDTTEIGTAGAGLTDLGGMSTGMKAEIETEANDALVALKLDHLVAVADSDDPVNDCIIAKLAASDGDWSGFDNTTDSQEAIRNRGDTSWVTGAGGSDRLLMVDTTIATLASQTSFTLTAGSADNDAYHNCTIVIEDASTSTQKAVGLISAYTGSTKTVTLKYDPGIFTMVPTDKVYVLAENALKATLANRQLNVAADGDVAGNVDGSVSSVVGAAGSVTGAVGSVTGNVGGNVTGSVGSVVGAVGSVTGAVDSVTGNVGGNVVGSTGTVTGAVGSVTGNVGGNVTGSVGSVVGAVGSVTGNVDGNVTGSVGSITGHTAQTGDTYALANGASGFVNIIADTNELQNDWVNGGRLDQIVDAIKVKTDNLPDGIKKNTAITAFTFLMVQAADHVTGATGLTVSGQFSGDGGVVAALTNTGAITEISNGLYEIDLTAGELNYDNVTLIFTATGADARVITIHPST